jgi:hypothetical protein
MGNRDSKPREIRGSKAKEGPLDVPLESLLGIMLRCWGYSLDQILLFYMA